MPAESWTPRTSIAAECARRGNVAVATGCVALITDEEADPALLRALGGRAAEKFLDGRPHSDTYWLRVWGARGLLWNWHDLALDALRRACTDDSWRVREMAAKVVARHRVGDLITDMAALRDDPIPRVRTAAERAVALLTADRS